MAVQTNIAIEKVLAPKVSREVDVNGRAAHSSDQNGHDSLIYLAAVVAYVAAHEFGAAAYAIKAARAAALGFAWSQSQIRVV